MRLINCRAIAAIVVAVSASAGSAQTTLRYKFDEGQKLNYGIKQYLSFVLDINGQPTQVKIEQHLDTCWEVKKVFDDASASIALRITRARVKSDSLAMKFSCDTQGGQEPDDAQGKKLAALFKAFVAADIGMRISAQGVVSDVKFPKELADAAAKNRLLTKLGGTAFTEGGMKQLSAQAMIVLPLKALQKGDSWKSDPIEMRANGIAAESVVADTFDGIDSIGGKDFAHFSRKLTVQMKPNQPVGFKVKAQDSSGGLLFDVAAGQIASSDIREKVIMAAEGEEITATIIMEQTIQMKRE